MVVLKDTDLNILSVSSIILATRFAEKYVNDITHNEKSSSKKSFLSRGGQIRTDDLGAKRATRYRVTLL